jgi:hypothetical protein
MTKSINRHVVLTRLRGQILATNNNREKMKLSKIKRHFANQWENFTAKELDGLARNKNIDGVIVYLSNWLIRRTKLNNNTSNTSVGNVKSSENVAKILIKLSESTKRSPHTGKK